MSNLATGEYAVTSSLQFYPDTKFVGSPNPLKLPMSFSRYSAASDPVNKIVRSVYCSVCRDWFTVVAPLGKTSWFCPWCGEVINHE